jgi:hypothetical protein
VDGHHGRRPGEDRLGVVRAVQHVRMATVHQYRQPCLLPGKTYRAQLQRTRGGQDRKAEGAERAQVTRFCHHAHVRSGSGRPGEGGQQRVEVPADSAPIRRHRRRVDEHADHDD